MNDEVTIYDMSPEDADALDRFLEWYEPTRNKIERDGAEASGVAPGTAATDGYCFVRGIAVLRDSGFLGEVLEKMPPLPTTWPSTMSPFPYEEYVAILKGGPVSFPRNMLDDLISDIRAQVVSLQGLMENLEADRRNGSE